MPTEQSVEKAREIIAKADRAYLAGIGESETWEEIALHEIAAAIEQERVETVKELRSIIDFANRIAKSILDNRSSSAMFIVQQAYPDDIDGLDQPSLDEMMENVRITSALHLRSLLPHDEKKGEREADESHPDTEADGIVFCGKCDKQK